MPTRLPGRWPARPAARRRASVPPRLGRGEPGSPDAARPLWSRRTDRPPPRPVPRSPGSELAPPTPPDRASRACRNARSRPVWPTRNRRPVGLRTEPELAPRIEHHCSSPRKRGSRTLGRDAAAATSGECARSEDPTPPPALRPPPHLLLDSHPTLDVGAPSRCEQGTCRTVEAELRVRQPRGACLRDRWTPTEDRCRCGRSDRTPQWVRRSVAADPDHE